MKKGRLKGTRHFSFGFLIVFFILLMAVFSFVSLGGKAEAAITQVGQSETFNFTGGMQTFTVSVTGYYNIELYGASGGNSNTAAGYGRGGKVAGTIYLKAGDVLYIFVGGVGKEGVGSDSGGYNGGGNATGTFAGGGGGGATDIRVGGTSLVDRIMVAGGGGGHNDVNSTVIYGGGNGGGLTGGNGNCYDHGTVNISNTGKGASQTAGGALGTNSNASGSTSGSFGQGGNGGFNNDGHSGGGGGGGYYGGGGSAWHAGAGGGSSFISGYEGCDAVTRSGRHTGSSVHFSGYVFTNGSMVTGGAPAGNGKAVITLTSTQPQAGFTQQIDYTGGLYAYKIPLAGYYRVTLYGAAAGYVATGWGSGGSVTGVTFFPAETLVYVYVGGAGGANAGGYNGGGTGGGGGGGGATDIRVGGISLYDRIMVAGGGGGHNDSASTQGSSYGNGGGLNGGNGNYHPATAESYTGKGGGQASGGAGSTNATPAQNGSFGKGGDGGVNSDGHAGGGGGGGYFGGGGSVWHAGAGGGSSFISGYNGCNAMDVNGILTGQPKHYSGYVFTSASMTQGGNTGNGRAVFEHLTAQEFQYTKEIAFTYNGYAQAYTVTQSGLYQITLYGASGGNSNISAGWGTGGMTTGKIYLQSGTTLYFYVGGAGKAGAGTDTGGFNGGGNGIGTTSNDGGGGGGATDVRVGGTALINRIMVAGGGGGHNDNASTQGSAYGNGGGLTGGEGNYHPSTAVSYAGGGGGQTFGGAGSTNKTPAQNGSFGQGGNSGINDDGHVGGGGGGGYYGGGGSVWHAGAGGGSSFISGYPGCDAVNQYGAHTGTSTHFSGYTFFDANMTTGGRAGNGCAVLTAIQLDETPPSAPTLTPDRSASSGYYYDSVRVDFSGGADSGVGFSRFEYRIGDGSWTAGNSVVLSSALTSGTESKTLTVRAYDKVNNYSETQATYQFDRTVYTITYHNVTAGFTNPNPSGYNVETPVITLQNINRDGFTFGGFYNDAGFISPASTSIPKGSRGNKAYYVKLTLNAPTASLPSSATSTYGDTKTLTVVPYHTNSSVTYSYQWQIQPSGASSFSDIPSANAISYAYKTSATGIFSFRVTMRAHLDGFVSDPIMSGTLNLNVIRRDIYVYASAVVRTYGDQFVTPLPYTTSNDLVGEDTLYGALACPDLKQEAGLYPITAGTIINENNPNYNIIFQLNYYTVQRKDITVEVNGISTVYGDPLRTRYTYTATGFVNGDTALEGELSCPSLQQKAGVYPITAGTVTNENNKNYNIIYIGADYVISRKSIYITAMPLYRVYGEALLTVFPYIRSDDLINGDILSGALFCPSLEQSAGSYPILQGTLNNANNPNYDIIYTGADYVINKLEIKANPNAFAKIYGNPDPALTEVILTGVGGETVTAVYTREPGESAGSYDLLTVGFAEAQQNYTISFAEGGADGKFIINKRPITVTADGVNRIFGDPLEIEYTYQITSGSVVEGDTLLGELSCDVMQAAGQYPITQGTLTNDNNPNYSITYVEGIYIIAKASIGVTVPASAYFKVYGDSDLLMTAEATGIYGEAITIAFVRQSGEDAGLYDIIGAASLNGNYAAYIEGDSGKDKFEIRRRDITVVANPAGHIYGEADATLTFTVNNLPSGYTVLGSLTREAGRNAGSYAILQGSVTDENNPNYAITFVGNTYTIYRRPITVTAIDTGHTYGDPEAPLCFDSGDIAEGDILQGTPEREAGDAYRPEGYAITQGSVTDANNPNYRITFVNGTYRIYKRSLAVYPEVYTKTYGDPDPAFAQVVDGIPGEQVEVTFSAGGVSRAGTYPLISVSADDTNYSVYIPEGAEADKYIINRRPITVTAIAAGHIFGDADAPLNYDAVNLVSGDVLIGALTREAGSFWREGGYAILQGSITNENNPDYDITYIGATYTVHKRPVIVRALPSGHTYGEEGSNLPYTAENAITTMPLKGSLAREEGVHWREEGYAILQGTLNNANNPDYDITYYGATYTIHKRPIEVRADSKSIVYGDVDVPLTYTAVNLVAGDTLIGSLIKEEGRDWREEGYAILQGSITDENNPDYLITYYGAVYTIRKCNIAVTPSLFTKGYGEDDPELIQTANGVSGETFTVTFTRSNPETQSAGEYDISAIISVSDNNYTATIAAGAGLRKFVILRKDVTVTARDAFHIYGDTDAPLEFGFTELAYGETSLNGSLAREEGNTYREGGYRILQGTVDNLRNPNYNITFIEGVYTIKKRPVTIQAKDKTQPYGAAETPLEYEITEGSLIGGDTFTGAIIREPGIVVGEYAIRQGSLNNINYEITFIPAVYTIVKARITVTAEPKSITYGDEDVPLTYTLTPGLFYNDTLSGALTRQAGDAANEEGYDICLGTLGNPNYEIEFIPAKYIIYRKRITVTANEKRQVYGDPGQPLTYLTEGILKGELIGALAREEGNNYRAEGYAITQGTLTDENNPNYRITFVGARYYIDKRPITVTADNQTQIYGDEAKPLTYTITSGSLAEGDSLAGELERERGNLVRSYTILGGSLTDPTLNPNYIIRFNIGTYTIAPRPVTVKADDKSIVYGDNDVPLTYQITEGSLIGQDILQGALIRDSGRAAGVYAIRAGTLHNSNYAISFVQGSYTIERRPVTVEAIPLTFTYGDTPDFGYTVIGLLEGDSLTGTPGIPGPNAGVYNITQGTLTNANNPDYDIQFVSAVCVVGRRPITVTLKPQSSEYGAPVIINSKAYTVTSGSLVAGDDPGVTIERVSQSLMIGYYGLTASYTNQNYEVTFIASYYEIKKIKPVITVAHDYIEMAYTGKPYHIAAAANTHAAIQYRINGQAVENSFAEAGTYRVTLTAGETDIHYSPDPVTVTIVIKPTAITGENIIVYRQQGFGDASGLKIALTEREGEYAQYLTRTETLSDSYSIDFGGEAMATIIKVKVPDALMGKGSVKLLITEGEVTRVLNLSPDANGFVSFEISSSATVSFVAPMQSRSTLTTVIGVAVAIAAIICVFLIVKGSASRRR